MHIVNAYTVILKVDIFVRGQNFSFEILRKKSAKISQKIVHVLVEALSEDQDLSISSFLIKSSIFVVQNWS